MITDEALVPNAGDFRRAATFVASWAVYDLDGMLLVVSEANDLGRTIHLCESLAEMLVRGHDLRDSEIALAQWRADVARYTADEERENES